MNYTALIAKNKGYASGFDTNVNQEADNTICTHPSTGASCVSEGAVVSPVGNQTIGLRTLLYILNAHVLIGYFS